MCATPSETVRVTFLRVRVSLAIFSFQKSYFLIGLRGPLRVRALVLVRCPRGQASCDDDEDRGSSLNPLNV